MDDKLYFDDRSNIDYINLTNGQIIKKNAQNNSFLQQQRLNLLNLLLKGMINDHSTNIDEVMCELAINAENDVSSLITKTNNDLGKQITMNCKNRFVHLDLSLCNKIIIEGKEYAIEPQWKNWTPPQEYVDLREQLLAKCSKAQENEHQFRMPSVLLHLVENNAEIKEILNRYTIGQQKLGDYFESTYSAYEKKSISWDDNNRSSLELILSRTEQEMMASSADVSPERFMVYTILKHFGSDGKENEKRGTIIELEKKNITPGLDNLKINLLGQGTDVSGLYSDADDKKG